MSSPGGIRHQGLADLASEDDGSDSFMEKGYDKRQVMGHTCLLAASDVHTRVVNMADAAFPPGPWKYYTKPAILERVTRCC